MSKRHKDNSSVYDDSTSKNDMKRQPIHHSLNANLDLIKDQLGHSNDVIISKLHASVKNNISLAIVYIEGLADNEMIDNYILKPIMEAIRDAKLYPRKLKVSEPLEFLEATLIPISHFKKLETIPDLLKELLVGNTIILMDNVNLCLSCNTPGWEDRSVQEPEAQTVIRGPRDSFNETIRTNTALIRRRIKDPNLRIEEKTIGTRSKTKIAVVYIKGIADDSIVNEVHQRLNRIDVDAILESGYIEEFIEDGRFSPFPTVFNTERPDSVAAGLMEGRVAIVVDGTPFSLLVPAIFVQFLQAAEDYYQRSDIGTFTRLLRYFAFFLALITPALYIAITTFHQEMLPTELLVSLAAQREAIPFPAIVEALLMEVTFEILREAGVRMPRAVGPAISIVGALVLGEAAVQAGLVSPAMVIVVSITAISSFVFPTYNLAISVRILRFFFMIIASIFGLFGIILGLLILTLHLSSLRSFGVPYLSSYAPFHKKNIKDTFIRLPIWKMNTRPAEIGKDNLTRETRSTVNPSPKKK